MRQLLLMLVFIPLTTAAEFRIEEQDGLIHMDNGAGIRAVVAPEHGGELSGFAVKFNGDWHELLYRALDYGDQRGWRGKAPLLWPAVGASYTPDEGKHHWVLDGETQPMPFHGFARDHGWRVVHKAAGEDAVSVLLEMMASGDTRQAYPFDYRFRVEYVLDAGKLTLVYQITAASRNLRAMPFVIGNHITFRAPLIEGPPAASLRFHNDLPDELFRDANGTFSGEIRQSRYRGWHDVGWVHAGLEASRLGLAERDAWLSDPASMADDAVAAMLSAERLDTLAARIDPASAMTLPALPSPLTSSTIVQTV